MVALAVLRVPIRRAWALAMTARATKPDSMTSVAAVADPRTSVAPAVVTARPRR